MTHTQTETYGFSADQFLQDKVNELPEKSFKVLAAVIPAMYDDESSVHLDYVTVEGMNKRGIVATLPRLSWFLYSEDLRKERTGGTGYLLNLNTSKYGIYDYNVYEVNAAILVRLAKNTATEIPATEITTEDTATEITATEITATAIPAEDTAETLTLDIPDHEISHDGRGELITNLAAQHGARVAEYHSGDCPAPFEHLRGELFVLNGLVKNPSLLRAEVIETLNAYGVPAKQVRVLKHRGGRHGIEIYAPRAHSLLHVPVDYLDSVANAAAADARAQEETEIPATEITTEDTATAIPAEDTATAIPAEDTATEITATEITATEITATEITAPEIPATAIPAEDTATEITAPEITAPEITAPEIPAPEIPAHDDAELLDQWRAANRAGEGCGFGDPEDLDCEEDIYEAAEREEEALVICALNVPDSYLVSWFDEYWVVCNANGWWACRVTL